MPSVLRLKRRLDRASRGDMRKTGLTALMALSCALIAQSLAGPCAQAGDADARFLHFGAETEAPRGYSDMCRTLPDLCLSFAAETRPEAEPAGGTMCPLFACLMTLPRQTGLWQDVASKRRQAPELVPFTQSQRQQATALRLLPLFRMASVTMPRVEESAWPRLIAQINTHVNRHVKQVDDMRSYGRADLWRPAGTQPGATGDCEDLALEKRRELIASGFPAARLFMAIAFRQDVGLHAVLVVRLEDGDRVLDSHDSFVRPVARTGYAWLSLQQPGMPDRWFYPA